MRKAPARAAESASVGIDAAIHRARSLAGEATVHDGIPVTTPARTILDLAATLNRRAVERLLDQAENTRGTHVAALDAITRAHPNHCRARKLRAALRDHTPGTTLTRSGVERRFLALRRARGLPRPRVNQHVEGKERGFVFAGSRLVIETDSWRHHRSRTAFEGDREVRPAPRSCRPAHAALHARPDHRAARGGRRDAAGGALSPNDRPPGDG